MHQAIYIPGDGIGPEVMDAAREVIAAAGAAIQWHPIETSEFFSDNGSVVPPAEEELIRRTGWVLKGPIGTPVGKGHRSVNVLLRQTFDTYACFRPIKAYPGLPSRYPRIDLMVVRENSEDLYLGIESETAEGAVAEKRITRKASERIARFAFETARKLGRQKVTIAHKANILKKTDGLFLECCRRVAGEYPDIEVNDLIIDNLCMQLVIDPTQFDMILAPNLYGDILSDLAAGMVGGLGTVPGANLGETVAIYEAVHGTAPDLVGKGIANPTACILSGAMMLEAMGEEGAALRIRRALESVMSQPSLLTPDLNGENTTDGLVREIIRRL
jgi:isocitrate dehydrogenase (NAD+)